MRVPVEIFLRANQPYWFRISPDNGDVPSTIVRLDLPEAMHHGFQTYKSSELSQFGIVTPKEGSYDSYLDDELFVVSPQESSLFYRSKLKQRRRHEVMKTWGRATVQGFRSMTKSKLIRSLAKPNVNSTDAVISAFRDYTHFDAYSAWLHNEITSTFTPIAGDVDPRSDFVDAATSNILSEVFAASTTIRRELDSHSNPPDILRPELVWVNAFPVASAGSATEPTIRVVVCMYSRYKEYNLRKRTGDLIRSFLQQNLSDRYFDRLLRLNNVRAQIGRKLSLDSTSEFLRTVVKSVAAELLWETCSIFLRDPNDDAKLRLAAIWPEPRRLKRLKSQSYSISSEAMTALVFRHNKMLWSYDIQHDSRNTHTFDDPTETTPRDWIGVPIATPGSTAIGVLRVKNRTKLHVYDIPHFSSLDMHNVQAVAVEVASVLHQCDLFSERKKLADQRAREVREMEDFLRTFRHEIRSPLQAVCFAPERIGLLLREEGMISRSRFPKKLIQYLADFKATGNRLEMISKALTLNPDEIVKDFVLHNIYKDVVAPVLAFSVSYANKKKRYITVDKDSLLVNMMCDSVALSMAFHGLVDNAIKYSDSGTTIEIYGEPIDGGHQVVVENDTEIFSITDKEAKHVTGKYFRGSLPRDQKLEGSGIGLFLAHRIMELHGGSLVLLKKRSPVRFALRLKG